MLDATRAAWALKFPKRITFNKNGKPTKIKGSSVKFVLLCYAEHANENRNAWPSVTTVEWETGYDRKTVMDAVAVLRTLKLLTQTGLAKGATGRVPIYQLPAIIAGHDDSRGRRVKVLRFNGAENGTIADSIVPFSEANGPVSDQVMVPKTGHRTNHGTVQEAGRAASTRVGAPAAREKRTPVGEAAIAQLRDMGYNVGGEA